MRNNNAFEFLWERMPNGLHCYLCGSNAISIIYVKFP